MYIDIVSIESITAYYGGRLYRSKQVNVVSGAPQGTLLASLLFLLYTSQLFSILENKLIGYADESTLLSVVAESLNRDFSMVSEWCDLWGCN